MIRAILISFGLILFSISLYSQDVSFKSYQYSNPTSGLKFSMNIPQSWKEIPEQDGTGYFQSFVETDSLGTAVKKLCLDSVIYKLKYFSSPIPQAMKEMGFYAHGNNMFQYELNDFIHIVVGFEMKGNNYNGLNCSFYASLPCEIKKSKKKSAEMLYLFFSNGAETICIINNGISLTEPALVKIESTFKFIN
jgi:hypothetical protein